jgi:hypothetical protein
VGGIKKAFKGLLGIKTPDPVTPAQPAAEAAPVSQNPENSSDTLAAQLRKKSKGKQSLMISPTNASGTGGTGLNI